MKIGILTFHAAFNYGSMLQAWALQTALQNLGHEVKIINYRNSKQKRMYRKPFGSLNPLYLLGDLNKLRKFGKDYIDRRERWDKFERFMHDNMNLTEEYNYETWNDTKKNFNIIITGSDQIWNLNAYDFDDVYLGKGVPSEIKLIAYAPSLGPYPERMDKKQMKKYLKCYTHISTREEGARQFLLKNKIYPTVEKVLDPTMLLDLKNYESFITSESIIEEPYAYYYTPGEHAKILNKAIDICAQLNLPLFIDSGYFDIKIPKNGKKISSAGPKEFLSYIFHSKIVIGASFHLIVFAILMHKDFYCINGDEDDRLKSLLSILNLKDRFVSLNSRSQLNIQPINWTEVDRRLKQYQDKSYQFLKDALNK